MRILDVISDALYELSDMWRDGCAGIVAGIGAAYGLAYRVLDTQFVRVDTHPRACPQRRERVFVVGHLGGRWQRAAAVLLERESLCGNPAPRRQQGQRVTGTLSARTEGGGGLGTDFECGGGGVPVSHTLTGVESDASEDGTGRGTPLVAIPEVCGTLSDGAHNGGGLNGQDASSVRILPVPFDTTQITSKLNRSNPKAGDPCHPLAEAAHPPTIAFSAKDYGQDAQNEVSPTLRAGNEDGSHANGGVMPAIAIQGTVIGRGDRSGPSGSGHDDKGAMFTLTKTDVHAVAFQPRIARNGRGDMSQGVVHALQAQSGQTGIGDAAPCVATFQQSSMKGKGTIGYDESGIAKPCKTQQDGQMVQTQTAVRRLTPVECARLQAFPDDYLDVIHNGKPAKDGPKYRALGNAMSCNVMRWIGQRIQMAEDLGLGL